MTAKGTRLRERIWTEFKAASVGVGFCSLSRPSAGTGDRPGAGIPRYPGWLVSARRRVVRPLLPRPARVHRLVTSFGEVVRLLRHRIHLDARQLPLSLGRLLRGVPPLSRHLLRDVQAVHRRDAVDARHRLPSRVLHRALREAQDAPPPARHRPVLDELPHPRLRVADHPRPGVPSLPRSRALGFRRTPGHPVLRESRLHRRRVQLPAAHGAAAVRGARAHALVARRAAQDLGDSPFRAFRRITLPLRFPAPCRSLLVFIPLTGEYIIPVILGGNKTFYAGNLIAQQFLESRDWPLGSALAMVVIAR